MSEHGRALLTETERQILSGEKEVDDNYRWKVESTIRSRVEDGLQSDLEFLATHHERGYNLALEQLPVVFPCPRCGKVFSSATGAVDHALETEDDQHDGFEVGETPAYFDLEDVPTQ